MALPPPLREVEVDNARRVAGEVFCRNGQRLRDCFKRASMIYFCHLLAVVVERRAGTASVREPSNWHEFALVYEKAMGPT
jgi:hypothetical protein